MGGSIAVAIRRSDGREVVYDRWTNPLPYYTVDPLFRQENEETLRVFHDRVVESMKNGWGSEIINEIYPIHYGIIAVDFVTKDILSIQGYCQPCRAHFSYVRGEGMTGDPEDDMRLMLRLLEDGARPLNFDKFCKEYYDDKYVWVVYFCEYIGREKMAFPSLCQYYKFRSQSEWRADIEGPHKKIPPYNKDAGEIDYWKSIRECIESFGLKFDKDRLSPWNDKRF